MDAGSADGPGPRPDDAAAQPVAVLEELLAARGEHLLRTAVLLAGSRADGEDLLQAALERLFRRWRTIRGDPEGYLRRTLYHLAADGWRRNGAWRARLRLLGHPASVPDGTDPVDQRDQIIRLLSALPPRQRTAVVLRHWEDLSEAQTVAATGTAAAVAGATAGFALTAGTPDTGPIETTAYVVHHVSSALAATDAIGYTTAHYSGSGAIGFFSNRVVEWEFGDRSRQLIESSAGQPLVDNSARPQGGRGAITSVHYPSRDWMSITVPSSELPRPPGGNNRCEADFLSAFAAANTAADWKQIIQAGLACGMFTVAGRQWVDGVDAIKLTGRKPAEGTTIWVDPSSYLPVRLTGRVQLISGGTAKQDAAELTIDFRWLPPTSANLKELTAPIPNGFREVSG